MGDIDVFRKLGKAAAAAILACTLGVAAPAPAQAEDFVIAVGMALTGPLAFVGVPEVNAIKMAVDELNAQNFLGAGNKIVLVINDDANDRGQIMTLLNRAAKVDKALVFLGPANSSITIAIAPILNELQMPMFATAQTGEPLKTSQWYFKITTIPANYTRPLAEYAVNKVKIKRPAFIYTRDNEGQVGNTKSFRDVIVANGVKPVIEETILTSDTDFSAVATKIAAADPDSIWMGALAVQAANIAIQLKQAGVSKDVSIYGTSALGEEYLKAGRDAVENSYSSTDYNPYSTSPANVAFVENYKKRYGVSPDNYSAVGYAQVQVAAEAIKRSMPNPTREKVRDAITKMKDVPVIMGGGKWSVDANRVPQYEVPILAIKGGKFITAP
jgi:branched-chain amino acid transport system substrate-binding protein